jgi:hypothetical protein
MCHRALRVCDEPVKVNWSSVSSEDIRKQRRRMQEYPDDEDQILATWRKRAKLWEDLNHDRSGRQFSCEFQREHMFARQTNVDSYEGTRIARSLFMMGLTFHWRSR